MEAGSQMCYTTSWHRSWRQGHKYANLILTQTMEAGSQICYTSLRQKPGQDSGSSRQGRVGNRVINQKQLDVGSWMSEQKQTKSDKFCNKCPRSCPRQASSNPKWPVQQLKGLVNMTLHTTWFWSAFWLNKLRTAIVFVKCTDKTHTQFCHDHVVQGLLMLHPICDHNKFKRIYLKAKLCWENAVI